MYGAVYGTVVSKDEIRMVINWECEKTNFKEGKNQFSLTSMHQSIAERN